MDSRPDSASGRWVTWFFTKRLSDIYGKATNEASSYRTYKEDLI